MKKLLYLTISLSIISQNAQITFAAENQDSNTSITSNTVSNIAVNSSIASNTDSNSTVNAQNFNTEETQKSQNASTELDELDQLSLDGEKAGIVIEAPKQPSFLMNCVRKAGVALFLMPYIRMVNGYRNTKNFIIKWSAKTWNFVTGNNNTSKNSNNSNTVLQ